MILSSLALTPMLICARSNYDPHRDVWHILVLDAIPGQTPRWRRHNASDIPAPSARRFLRESDARAEVDQLNTAFDGALFVLPDPARRMSLQLRSHKARQCHERLGEEEQTMLTFAMARGRKLMGERVPPVSLYPGCEGHQQEVERILQEYPYVRSMLVSGIHRKQLLKKLPDGSWVRIHLPTAQQIRGSHRAKIANGFGLDELAHFGKTKATIRRMLAPESAAMLTQPGIQKVLADALLRRKRALVWGEFVFWYESDGTGWQVKERSGSPGCEDTEAVWHEGQIHSANFGRIVVLPYIKDNGERVRGHTKNGPHDGKSRVRQPGEELLIDFEQLDGDLMRSLAGQMLYE